MHRYPWHRRSREETIDAARLIEFAKSGGLDAEYSGPIPVQVGSMFGKLWRLMVMEYEEAGSLTRLLLMQDSTEDGSIYWRGVLVLYVFPLVTLVGACILRRRSQKEKPD